VDGAVKRRGLSEDKGGSGGEGKRMNQSIVTLIMGADLIVKAVIGILLFFSVYSWAIILYKFRVLSRVEQENSRFTRNFRRGKNLPTVLRGVRHSPIANLFRALSEEPPGTDREEYRRILRRLENLETARLERYLNFLATTGSTTPFIGLFGTVWGIMNSFRGIGAAGAASLAVVAPGIAEALIATAAGLVAAIPAVIAYNYYLSRVRRITIQMEDFDQELVDFFTRDDAGQ